MKNLFHINEEIIKTIQMKIFVVFNFSNIIFSVDIQGTTFHLYFMEILQMLNIVLE